MVNQNTEKIIHNFTILDWIRVGLGLLVVILAIKVFIDGQTLGNLAAEDNDILGLATSFMAIGLTVLIFGLAEIGNILNDVKSRISDSRLKRMEELLLEIKNK